MTRKDRKCLENMLEFAGRVQRRICNITYEEFSHDKDRQDMILYALGQIGENADNVSEGFRENHHEILWSPIIGLRNRIFHVYENINMKLVFDIATDNTAELIRQLEPVNINTCHNM